MLKKNGKIIFEGEREIRITNRDGRYAKKYGKFVHLYIINSNYPEFADWALTQNGTFYDDCSDNIWELSLFKLK